VRDQPACDVLVIGSGAGGPAAAITAPAATRALRASLGEAQPLARSTR
jgi:succinate dehydrogenase/fumarate reductase flavoprotein subunit